MAGLSQEITLQLANQLLQMTHIWIITCLQSGHKLYCSSRIPKERIILSLVDRCQAQGLSSVE
jgi:hypothetical protein